MKKKELEDLVDKQNKRIEGLEKHIKLLIDAFIMDVSTQSKRRSSAEKYVYSKE